MINTIQLTSIKNTTTTILLKPPTVSELLYSEQKREHKKLLESKLPRGKLQIKCSNCEKLYTTYRNKVILALLNNRHLFCSLQCFRDRKNKTQDEGRISYFCNDCYKFTPKDSAIMYKTKNGNRTYPICPYCKRKTPMRVKAHAKRKTRENTVKRIE